MATTDAGRPAAPYGFGGSAPGPAPFTSPAQSVLNGADGAEKRAADGTRQLVADYDSARKPTVVQLKANGGPAAELPVAVAAAPRASEAIARGGADVFSSRADTVFASRTDTIISDRRVRPALDNAPQLKERYRLELLGLTESFERRLEQLSVDLGDSVRQERVRHGVEVSTEERAGREEDRARLPGPPPGWPPAPRHGPPPLFFLDSLAATWRPLPPPLCHDIAPPFCPIGRPT